jgi:uncharacterized protein YbjT (DUF2867 family)
MKRKLKTAVIFGSSGLTGFEVLKQLCDHPNYGKIICYNRKPLQYKHEKFEEIVVDFDKLSGSIKKLEADEVYCCLGTTIKKAGSQQAFRKVDLDYPVEIGKLAEQNKIRHYLVVSSIGANHRSGNFYLKTKGAMEEAISKYDIPQITFARPSMLLGDRKEYRFGEEMGKILLKVISPFMIGKLKKYRGIQAETVANAMIIIANSSPVNRKFFESHELEEIVRAEG